MLRLPLQRMHDKLHYTFHSRDCREICQAAVEGLIGFVSAAEKLDPRAAIRGRDGAGQSWESGLFDKGTWREANSGWARTVVTGRARLAGVAVGKPAKLKALPCKR